MKASYKTAAIAKAQATARTKKTGEAHVFYSNEAGTEFFVITQAEQDAAVAAALAAAQKTSEAEAKVTPIRAKRSSIPAGVGAASWKWIMEHLPEGEIEDVAVRHANGKRYNLKVNGAQVWYSFTEEGANAAKEAVLALKAAKQ